MTPKYFNMSDVHGVCVLGQGYHPLSRKTNKQTKTEEHGMFLNSWRLLSVITKICASVGLGGGKN